MIHSPKEWEAYRETITIKGRGGTDFRPVFQKVEELRKQHVFRNLKALIYFTDGDGIYPEQTADRRMYSLNTTDKKASRKIKHRKISRVHKECTR